MCSEGKLRDALSFWKDNPNNAGAVQLLQSVPTSADGQGIVSTSKICTEVEEVMWQRSITLSAGLRQCLIERYIKSGDLGAACRLVGELKKERMGNDVGVRRIWNPLLSALGKQRLPKEAKKVIDLYYLMIANGFEPDALTYTRVFRYLTYQHPHNTHPHPHY